MSSDESEEEIDQSLSNSDVGPKYRAAAIIVNKVVAEVIKQAIAGKNILELCEFGDKLLLDEARRFHKQDKSFERGIAFPTCISVNNIAGHYSPEVGDKAELKDGDVVKIDLGVHLDGYIALSAHTHVVGNTQATPTTGKAADAICAAHIAADAILRLLKPGNKNTSIAPLVKKIVDTFHVNTLEAVLSHQMKRFVIDGTKVIPNKAVADQAVEEFAFEENDVFAIDVVVTTGQGKTREMGLKPTIYKRDVDEQYSLKLAASRKVFSEVTTKYPALPFTIRSLEEKHARFGLGELEKHGLIHPYPILYEKEGEIVAQFKYTALVGPLGAVRITEHPLPYVQSQYSVEDEEVKALLTKQVKMKKKNKGKGKGKGKKSKKSKTETPATPMDTN